MRAKCLPDSVSICYLPAICFQERRQELSVVQVTQYACWLVPTHQAEEGLGRLSSVKVRVPTSRKVIEISRRLCLLEKDE